MHLDEGARALAAWVGDARQALLDQRTAGRCALRQGVGVLFYGAHSVDPPWLAITGLVGGRVTVGGAIWRVLP